LVANFVCVAGGVLVRRMGEGDGGVMQQRYF
jgi:hypothetical protein